MSRVANDTAWKRRVLKEEAVLERKNVALARGNLSSSTGSSPAPYVTENIGSVGKAPSLDGRRSVGRKTPSGRNTPSPSLNAESSLQGLRHDLHVESIRAASSRKFDPAPRSTASSRASQDNALNVSSYSSGTSIQSYPSTRSGKENDVSLWLQVTGLVS
jgi:hypothetical protein